MRFLTVLDVGAANAAAEVALMLDARGIMTGGVYGLEEFKLLDGMPDFAYSSPLIMNSGKGFAFGYEWDGTLAGTVVLQIGVRRSQDIYSSKGFLWKDTTEVMTDPAGTPGSFVDTWGNMYASAMRLKFSYTGGEGNFHAYANVKD